MASDPKQHEKATSKVISSSPSGATNMVDWWISLPPRFPTDETAPPELLFGGEKPTGKPEERKGAE